MDIVFSLYALLCTYFLKIISVLCSSVSVNLNLASAAEVSKKCLPYSWVILNFAIFAGY